MNATPPALSNHVSGAPRLLLRLEGGCVLAASAVMYHSAGFSWTVFALCFLLPDASLIGYLAGPRVGALIYNMAHTYVAPCLLAAGLAAGGWSFALPLIWAGHIGFDRVLGYGLKYPTAFQHTHLGQIGNARGRG
jgi:Domain of unknown function (DUF4260)